MSELNILTGHSILAQTPIRVVGFDQWIVPCLRDSAFRWGMARCHRLRANHCVIYFNIGIVGVFPSKIGCKWSDIKFIVWLLSVYAFSDQMQWDVSAKCGWKLLYGDILYLIYFSSITIWHPQMKKRSKWGWDAQTPNPWFDANVHELFGIPTAHERESFFRFYGSVLLRVTLEKWPAGQMWKWGLQ